MRLIASLAVALFTMTGLPALAADKVPQAEQEIEMPEIIIELPAAKFEHAIVRDNEEPVVLLLV